MDDFRKMKVGTILDILISNSNDNFEREKERKQKEKNKGEEIRDANKNDNILSFF